AAPPRLAGPSEVEDPPPLVDLGRAARRGEVLLYPPGGALGRLLGAGLVLAGRHSHPAVAAAKGCVADEAGHRSDQLFHVVLALLEEVKQLRCTLAGVAPNDYMHDASP